MSTPEDEAYASGAKEIARWEQAIGDELERLFDRQEAVVLARLQGTKARKHTRHWEPAGDRVLEVKQVIDPSRWIIDSQGAVRPVVKRLFKAVMARVAEQARGVLEEASAQAAARRDAAAGEDDEDPAVEKAIDVRLARVAQGIESATAEVEAFIAREEAAGASMADIVQGVQDLYAARKPVWAARIATVSAVGSINQAALIAAGTHGATQKRWLSRRDEKVRPSHQKADGQVRDLNELFQLGGPPPEPLALLMFPGDPAPTVPGSEVFNCRCLLMFNFPRTLSLRERLFGKALPMAVEHPEFAVELDGDLEVKDKVRTPGGARQYGQPIGSTIVRDPFAVPAAKTTVAGLNLHDATGDPAAVALVNQHNPAAGADASTRILTAVDGKGRTSAYVAWDKDTGRVLAVSVHPSLAGRRIGDQMVAAAKARDPKVQPSRPPRAPAPIRASAPATRRTPSQRKGPNGLPVIASRTKPGDTPGTSGDFDADAKRIERLQRAYLADRADTSTLFARGGRWLPSREKQQQDIIDHFLNKPGVKKGHQILILGGLPGAGKTTTINSPAGQAELGIDLSEYVTVNADEVKAEMVARGMVPDYPGLTPDEAATLYHAESFEIAHSLMRQSAKRGLNFAYDTSLKTSSQAGFATGAGSRAAPPPWKVTMVLVDVPLPVAKQRARDRYLAGGRYMPLSLIDSMRASSRSYSSGPAEQFAQVKRTADSWVVFDNAGADPVVADSGGRRAGRGPRPARAPRPPSAAPPPAVVPVAPQVAPVVPSNLPPVPAGTSVYVHPSGKHVYVLPDGSMQVWKADGKRGTTSASPQKLAAGYGAWKQIAAADGDTHTPAVPSAATAPLVAAPSAPLDVSAGAPAPAHAMPVAPMDFLEADLSDVPKFIADDNYVFQQKVDGIRGVLVIEAGKPPWFASKKGDRLVSSTAAKITTPMLAKLPATPAGSPSYRVEGELLNGKFHVFDMVVVGEESAPYEKRKRMADAWVEAVAPALPQVEALPTAVTAAEKQALWDRVRASGAEGVMMKRKDAGYDGGARVSHTLKAKVTATADVVVLERNRDGKDNAVIGLLVGGKVTEIGTVNTGGKDKALGQIVPGEVVEVEYLWATPQNTLAQPRILRKRPDKTVVDITDATQLRQVDKQVLDLAAQVKALRLELKAGRAAPSVSGLIAGLRRGDEGSLQALAVALAAVVHDTPDLPSDPTELVSEVEDRGAEAVGTWQEVRAARDFGDLTDAEYQYLLAAVEALTQEES